MSLGAIIGMLIGVMFIHLLIALCIRAKYKDEYAEFDDDEAATMKRFEDRHAKRDEMK